MELSSRYLGFELSTRDIAARNPSDVNTFDLFHVFTQDLGDLSIFHNKARRHQDSKRVCADVAPPLTHEAAVLQCSKRAVPVEAFALSWRLSSLSPFWRLKEHQYQERQAERPKRVQPAKLHFEELKKTLSVACQGQGTSYRGRVSFSCLQISQMSLNFIDE